MNIGKIQIKNPAILAPMASITDKPFRTLCKMLGAGLTYTEMVSVKGLYYKSKKTEELLATSNLEHPCAVQLFGHEPEIFKSVLESGILDKFDIIDINMGCPAPKIVKNGDGSSLMNNIELASEIIKSCVCATDKPITVKFRKGFKKNEDKLIEFAKMCEKSGASAITIHPRTREDMFSGKISLEDIKKVKENVNITVIGNGDILDYKSFLEMLKVCDGVMIGRTALKKPEIFTEIILNNKDNSACINNDNSKKDISLNDFSFYKHYNELVDKDNKFENCNLIPNKLQIIKMHLALLKKEYSETFIVKIFKKYILSYLNGFNNATTLKKEIVLVNDLKIMEDMIFKFFNCLNLKE